jgi:hypothetical protein
MPGDPKESVENRHDCLRMASTAPTPLARERFEELARIWVRLATSLENAQVLMDQWSDPVGVNMPKKKAS